MDIIHHSLIGMAGFLAASEAEQLSLGAAFMMGSVFPDLDVALMIFGKRFYLKNHQALTHSLPLSPLYALVLATPLYWIDGFSPSSIFAALLGLWLHIALDWSNTYRIAPFAPFSYRRYSLDAVFFIDVISLMLTSSYSLAYMVIGANSWLNWSYGSLFFAYLVAKWRLQRYVRQRMQVDIAIPTSLNPFSFYLYREAPDGYYSCHYNLLNHHVDEEISIAREDDEVLALAAKSRTYQDMKTICRTLPIVEVRRNGKGTLLLARDLAVRNFGGRFGRTTLRFDKCGELIDEMADI